MWAHRRRWRLRAKLPRLRLCPPCTATAWLLILLRLWRRNPKLRTLPSAPALSGVQPACRLVPLDKGARSRAEVEIRQQQYCALTMPLLYLQPVVSSTNGALPAYASVPEVEDVLAPDDQLTSASASASAASGQSLLSQVGPASGVAPGASARDEEEGEAAEEGHSAGQLVALPRRGDVAFNSRVAAPGMHLLPVAYSPVADTVALWSAAEPARAASMYGVAAGKGSDEVDSAAMPSRSAA